jgi:hypothetical protein
MTEVEAASNCFDTELTFVRWVCLNLFRFCSHLLSESAKSLILQRF